MIDELRRIAECKNCGALHRESNTGGGCSNCGYNETETVEVNSVAGGTVENEKPWYRTFELVARRVEE